MIATLHCLAICSAYLNSIPVLSTFMTYHRVCNKSNTTGAWHGAGTAHSSGAPHLASVYFYTYQCGLCCPFC